MSYLDECPCCGGFADNGHDRCVPPNPYYCTKCDKLLQEGKCPACKTPLEEATGLGSLCVNPDCDVTDGAAVIGMVRPKIVLKDAKDLEIEELKHDNKRMLIDINAYINLADKYEKALREIGSVITHPCDDNKCGGCRWEMSETVEIVQEALKGVK